MRIKAPMQPHTARTGSVANPAATSIPRPLSMQASHPAMAPISIYIYALTIFLGAFLLFQVQLILGKFVLPRFGGGPSVWSASLLTFQLLLLAGYGYAAVLTQYFPRKLQARIHLGFLSLCALLLIALAAIWHSPILPLSATSSSASDSPVVHIVYLLMSAVGLPCVLLSASSPLLQKWFSDQTVGAAPYRLYALSNFGSMLGLLSYPFVVERLLRLPVQAWLWAVVYIAFLIMTAICAWRQPDSVPLTPTAVPTRKIKNEAPPRKLWPGRSGSGWR